MTIRSLTALALAVAACNTTSDGARKQGSPNMSDLVRPEDRPPPAPRTPDAPTAPSRVDEAAARMDAAMTAAHDLPTAAAKRAELRRRLGPPALDLDGWIEWAVADDDSCVTLWFERVDEDGEQHRYEPLDGGDRSACRALAGGDARARIIGDVVHARGDFADAAAARAWLTHTLRTGPSQQKTIDGVRRSRWSLIVDETCFQVDVYDDERGRAPERAVFRSYEDEYALCANGAAHGGA